MGNLEYIEKHTICNMFSKLCLPINFVSSSTFPMSVLISNCVPHIEYTIFAAKTSELEFIDENDI